MAWIPNKKKLDCKKKQSALCLVPPSPRVRFSVDALGAAPAGLMR